MKRIFLFENKKFFRNYKNVLLILLVILFSLFLCYKNNQNLKVQKEESIDNARYLMDRLMTDSETYSKSRPELESYFIASMNKLSEQFEYAYPKGWRKSLEAENEFIDSISFLKSKIDIDYVPDEYLKNKTKNMYYLKHNIKPDNCLYGISGMYFVRYICSVLFSNLGYVFFLLLFFELLLKESHKPSVKFLKTLSIPYNYFEKARLVVALKVLLFISCAVICFTFISGWVLSQDVGNLLYPIFYSYQNEYISMNFLLYFLLCLFTFVGMNCFLFLILIWLSRYQLDPDRIVIVFIAIIISISEVVKPFETMSPYFLYINYFDTFKSISSILSKGFMRYHVIEVVGMYLINIVIMKKLFSKNNKYIGM